MPPHPYSTSFVQYAYEKNNSSKLSTLLNVRSFVDYDVDNDDTFLRLISVHLSSTTLDDAKLLLSSKFAHLSRLDIVLEGSQSTREEWTAEVGRTINTILAANVNVLGIRHFSLKTGYRKRFVFEPLPNSLPQLRVFYGPTHTLQYLNTSSYLHTVYLIDEKEAFFISFLPILSFHLTIHITEIVLPRISNVSQTFIDLIAVAFPNLETFAFNAIERSNQSQWSVGIWIPTMAYAILEYIYAYGFDDRVR
ncbi:hypothetical protein M422DRAFT_242871 [Sphaerobolus stellatus SS14]|nr:hypothetical protein M422DRAFT_242871 [Sphaerobolus stellatus SS14]